MTYITKLDITVSFPPSVSQVRVVLLAATPLEQMFVHTGGDDERDRQLLDDLGLSGVNHMCYNTTQHNKLNWQENPHLLYAINAVSN